jgi:hypothetical protein
MTAPAWSALLVAGFALAVAPALAEDAGPDNPDSRYSFHRAEDGYLRLDGRTGEVALCNRRTAGWMCRTLPDERAAFENEIARLQSDNAALKKQLLSHNLPLPSGVAPDQAQTKVEEPRLQVPSDQEINRMMAVVEKIWRRVIEMVVTIQKDMAKKS